MADVHWQQVGTGEHAVIALNGWLGSAQAWRPLQPYLDKTQFRYVFPDYRGYGTRRDVAGQHTLAEAAADTLTVADELGLDRFSLLGHSMGGVVMQHVLADAPDRVRAMIGISPVPANGVPFDEESWKLFAGAPQEPANRRTILDLTTGHRLTGVWLDAMVQHSLDNSDPQAVAEYLHSWSGANLVDQIAGQETPVKVIVGEHDPALGADTMHVTFMQHYPRCEVDVLANAGHYAIDETPIALATSIENFLSKM